MEISFTGSAEGLFTGFSTGFSMGVATGFSAAFPEAAASPDVAGFPSRKASGAGVLFGVGTGAPHLWQNLAFSRISVPHFLQNMPDNPLSQILLQIASTISLYVYSSMPRPAVEG